MLGGKQGKKFLQFCFLFTLHMYNNSKSDSCIVTMVFSRTTCTLPLQWSTLHLTLSFVISVPFDASSSVMQAVIVLSLKEYSVQTDGLTQSNLSHSLIFSLQCDNLLLRICDHYFHEHRHLQCTWKI